MNEQDVRDLVGLLGEAISMDGTIPEKRRFLLDGLLGIIGAGCWMWCLIDPVPGLPESVIRSEYGGDVPDDPIKHFRHAIRQVGPLSDGKTRALTFEGDFSSACRLVPNPSMNDTGLVFHACPDALIGWRAVDSENGLSLIALFKEPSAMDFGEREIHIAEILLAEIPWLHEPAMSGMEESVGPSLYPRHRAVLKLLCEGWGRKQIADHLGLSINTVHGYSKTIFSLFGVHSQAELISRLTTVGANHSGPPSIKSS